MIHARCSWASELVHILIGANEYNRAQEDPLDVSPANPEVSKRKGAAENQTGGSKSQSGQGNSERSGSSGGGSPAKNG